MYGFDISGVPSSLFIRSGESPSHENGIGFVDDSLGNREIDNMHFAQIDLGDFLRARDLTCNDPLLKIGSIQVGESFAIYGSSTLGVKGELLYSYTNTINNSNSNASREFVIPSYNTTDLSSNGDLYKYGPVPYRYISVTSPTGNSVLNTITLNVCSCDE